MSSSKASAEVRLDWNPTTRTLKVYKDGVLDAVLQSNTNGVLTKNGVRFNPYEVSALEYYNYWTQATAPACGTGENVMSSSGKVISFGEVVTGIHTDAWLRITNSSTFNQEVEVTLFFENGIPTTLIYPIYAGSTKSIKLNEIVSNSVFEVSVSFEGEVGLASLVLRDTTDLLRKYQFVPPLEGR